MRIDRRLIRQIVLYGLIGGGSASLDLAIFTFLYETAGVNELLANVISVHCGIAVSFILNSQYNFKKTDKILFRGLSFYCTGLFGLSLSGGLIWLAGRMAWPILETKVISIFIVAAVQFVLNKFISFRK